MNDHARLKHAFEKTPTPFQLLATARSGRVGRECRIEWGTEITHPISGRKMAQAAGPMRFVSQQEPLPLTRLEEALYC
jgi:hypothetical protein